MDWSNVIIGLLAFAGTLLGVLSGSKMMMYRIEQLEKKVEKHNNIVERTYRLEDKAKELEQDVKEIKDEIHSIVGRRS